MIFFLSLWRRRLWLKASPANLGLWVFGVFAAHVVAMMLFEGMSLFDGIWLTATTIVTVGYGDLSAESVPGRWATMALYGAGIFTLASAVNQVQEITTSRRDRKRSGHWEWKMKDHIVFVSPKTGHHEDFVASVVRELRISGSKRHALLLSVGEREGLPQDFEGLDIAIVRTSKIDDRAMNAASIANASNIIIMDDDDLTSGSAFVVDTLSRLRGQSKADIIVEAMGEDEPRIKSLGGDRVVRPFRVYPELLSREIVAPGSASLIQELFSAHGSTLSRIDLTAPVMSTWGDVVTRILNAHSSIAIAYDDGEKVVCCPPVAAPCSIKSIYVLTEDAQALTGQTIQKILT